MISMNQDFTGQSSAPYAEVKSNALASVSAQENTLGAQSYQWICYNHGNIALMAVYTRGQDGRPKASASCLPSILGSNQGKSHWYP